MSNDLKTRTAAALEGVTNGPWVWEEYDHQFDPYDELIGAGGICIISDGSAGGEYSATIKVPSPNARFIAASRDLVPELLARVVKLEAALREIAAYDDNLANRHLELRGSYSGFDEPASVQTAREALEGK